MKLKKLISVVSAISMLSAFAFTTAQAAGDNVTIHVYAEEFKDTTATNYKAVSGYKTYKVSYTLEGVDSAANAPTAITIDYTPSTTDTAVVAAKSFSNAVTGGLPANRDLNGVYKAIYAPMTFSAKQISIVDANGLWNIYDYETYPSGSTAETLVFLETLYYVAEGESLDITYNTLDAEDSLVVLDDNTQYHSDKINFTVNGTATNVLTLGKAEEEKKPYEIANEADLGSDKKTYTVADKDGENPRYVAEQAFGATEATKATVVKATYKGEEKGRALYALLGIEGDGAANFDSILIKMLLPAADAAPEAGDFNIVIE